MSEVSNQTNNKHLIFFAANSTIVCRVCDFIISFFLIELQNLIKSKIKANRSKKEKFKSNLKLKSNRNKKVGCCVM